MINICFSEQMFNEPELKLEIRYRKARIFVDKCLTKIYKLIPRYELMESPLPTTLN